MSNNRLSEIRARLGELPTLPYKEFPMFVLEFDHEYKETEKSKLMNQYMKFGYKAQADIAHLLSLVERYERALEQIEEVTRRPQAAGTRKVVNEIAREALKHEGVSPEGE